MNLNHTASVTEGISVEIVRETLNNLISFVHTSSEFQSLVSTLKNDSKPIQVSGLSGSLSSFVLTSIFRVENASILLICSDDDIERYENDLPILLGKDTLVDFTTEPALVLSSLLTLEKKIIITTPPELCKKVIPKKASESKILKANKGEPIGYERLEQFLVDNGFTRKAFIEEEGDYAVRGSIVDIFSFGASDAARLEFFGDDIDSIRSIDINSQLSKEPLQSIDIVSNLALPSNDAESLLNYLSPNTLVISDNTADFGEDVDSPLFYKKREIISQLHTFRQLEILNIGKGSVDFNSKPQQKLNSNFSLFGLALERDFNSGKQIIFASTSQKEVDELVEFISAEKEKKALEAIEEKQYEKIEIKEDDKDILLKVISENLYEGFQFNSLSLFTESDVFGKLHSRKRHKKRKRRQISLRELRALKVGDYIVHEDYGIGVFMGLERITAGNSEQEAVLVQYDKGDSLFVNLQNLNLLSKYSSSEGSKPTLSRLGSEKWSVQKEKIKKRLKDIARNLITLYAKRKSTQGFAHKPDTVWQREFEASFVFDETADQLQAIQAVKEDLIASSPMDRLVCGDAGFGKTEVAMRAAFKAVESGKQVAVLVPTTILAHQHFNSFKLRFQNFPIRIEVLSRFVGVKEVKRIAERIKEGQVDIVIGTHRLISKDIIFKDLGLFIIDEEQHFGVAAKEKLREQFPTVDTLILTATPIPRTLQFSMMGARDLSIISTPPKNRQPIETIVHEYDEDLLQEAVAKEIGRGGQVFILNNRINSLGDMLDTVKRLVPKARVGIGHGQMPAKELEQVMMDFLQKELNVLICTTIIESGLDISNVNTIIINRADMFGLSDLYQLRGRVGRSDRKAYCYLFTPPASTLNQDALQRLAAIEEFTELGSGFNVALRDLDIRGAGNLLGAEQSGFVYDLGFDLYQKILEEAVEEIKSSEFQNVFKEVERKKELSINPCEVTFFFNAFIPTFFVESASERFALYEKLSKALTHDDLTLFEKELEDRFGKLPEDVKNLIAVSRLRIDATALSLTRLEISEKKCSFIFPEGESNSSFYQGEQFGKILAAIQSVEMKPFQPVFKNDRRLKLDVTFEYNLKSQPDRAIQTVQKIVGLLQQN